MSDRHLGRPNQSITYPSGEFVAVTPNDSVDLPGGLPKAIFVGNAGNVVAVNSFGNDVVIVSASSQYHPIRPVRIKATGTTATNIVALY